MDLDLVWMLLNSAVSIVLGCVAVLTLHVLVCVVKQGPSEVRRLRRMGLSVTNFWERRWDREV